MKKFLTFALVCCLVFSSSSTVFATATQWDTNDQKNLNYIATSVTSGGSLYTLVNNIYTRVNTISNTLTDIKGYLYQNNHSIAYWVEAINSWMQPIYSRLSDILTQSLNIEAVAGLLGSTDVVDGNTVRTPYLAYDGKGVAQIVSELSTDNENLAKALTNFYLNESISNPLAQLNTHRQMVGADWYYTLPNFRSSDFTVDNSGYNINWRYGSPLGNIALIMRQFEIQMVTASSAFFRAFIVGYNGQQTYTTWNGETLATSTFTPSSGISGIYTWLSKIQEPVARLSYVLASDQDIEARQAAADNQEAVVDNFIDSSGSGATSTSDIGSVSDLSSGFKDNISTEASVSGIWNIFNSDNFGWFSQETADQLDTTRSGQRTLRSSGSYPTPLLDQQTEDILNYIGGDDND